jgi:hypothetical protein
MTLTTITVTITTDVPQALACASGGRPTTDRPAPTDASQRAAQPHP